MKIILRKEKWLHDVANLAYVAADISGGEDAHAVHQTFDICEAGNGDRVARVAGLAFAAVQEALGRLARVPRPPRTLRDLSAVARDYVIELDDCRLRHAPAALPVLVKELAHEYIVCMVLADWLSLTLPALAPPWREKARLCLERLRGCAAGPLPAVYRRRIPQL